MDIPGYIRPSVVLVVKAGDRILYGHLEDNPSARALIENLNPQILRPITDSCGSDKWTGVLPFSLPRCDEKITTEPGDVILYGSDRIAILFDGITAEFTRLARISCISAEILREIFCAGNTPVEIFLEWGE